MALSEQEVLKKAQEWTKAPYSKECIEEIQSLIKAKNTKELTERFAVDLDFGTGGMRGLIRFGTNGMNIHIVARATQGLSNYVISNGILNAKAAIAYDSRKYSEEFAKEAAIVLASNGIKTYLFKALRPTPELSYAVRKLGCTTGIVVTASHNPKEYNGYKVYWNDGAQVVPPHDKLIIEEVRKVQRLDMVVKKDFDDLLKSKMIEMVGEEIDDQFINEILKLSINPEVIKKSPVKIVFTPLHGTGATLVPKALEKAGFKDVVFVDEQMKADPLFSTVKYPNPEEKEALSLGIKKAEETHADLVIATDPDADRMGVVVRGKDSKYHILSGNQIGSILEYYILSAKKEKGTLPANGAIVKTIVTTNLQDEIGKSFGMKVFNVLTGFKYIGQKIREFEEDRDYIYQFGGEESYGYLPGVYARDKDAVAASVMIAECAAYIKEKKGYSLLEYMDKIYGNYGFYHEETISKTIPGLAGVEIIKKIMEYFRDNRINSLFNIHVVKTIDYKNQDVKDCEGGKYNLPSADVIQYFMEDGSKITLRPSGTEPKIKFYFSTKGKNEEDAKMKTDGFVKDFMPLVETVINKNS